MVIPILLLLSPEHLHMVFPGFPLLPKPWQISLIAGGIDRQGGRFALGFWGVHYIYIASGKKSNTPKHIVECAQAVKEQPGQYDVAVPSVVHMLSGWVGPGVWINEDCHLAMP